MSYSFTDTYDKEFLKQTMMGPNAMRITEELVGFLPVAQGMKVLDLGCGMGLSSIFLAEKYGTEMVAADLWISPTDNYKRFLSLGLEEKIFPLSLDVTRGLPFADKFFDILISIDAYHYFGAHEEMLASLVPCVKSGGYLGVVIPGLKKDFTSGVPEEIRPFWQENMNFYSCAWWECLWKKEKGIRLEVCREMDCFQQAWNDWLVCPNPYARGDIAMMEAEGGKYFNLVQLVARVL